MKIDDVKKYFIKKGNIIFLLLPTDYRGENAIDENMFNINAISRIGHGLDVCWVHTIGETDSNGKKVYLSYEKLKLIIKCALEDNISDIIPIISRSEILEIEK